MILQPKIPETPAGTNSAYANLEKELLLFAEVQGKQNGSENRPLAEPEFRALFLNKIESRVQNAIHKNQELHRPVSGIVVAQKSQTDAAETIKPIAANLKDRELEYRTLEEIKKQYTPDLRKQRIRRLVHIGAGIIAVAEGFFAFEALRRMPMSTLPALITSIGIAVAIGFGTHVMAGYIRKAKTTIQFIKRFCICVIPALIGFYTLGQLRANGYNTAVQMNLDVHQQVTIQTGVSAIGITILSFLLFLAGLIFSIWFCKTEQEKEEEFQYDKACDELKKCGDKMQEMRSAIEKAKYDAEEQSAGALNRYEYALAIENRLKSLAKQVTQEYILKNLNYRTDGIMPAFFANPPAYQFTTFFDNVKTSNNENN